MLLYEENRKKKQPQTNNVYLSSLHRAYLLCGSPRPKMSHKYIYSFVSFKRELSHFLEVPTHPCRKASNTWTYEVPFSICMRLTKPSCHKAIVTRF